MNGISFNLAVHFSSVSTSELLEINPKVTTMDENVLNQLDPRVLGARLQDARKARGLTQLEVARLMKMARTTLVAIEKGERRLSPDELIRLVGLYGRPVSEFVARQTLVEGFVPQFRAVLRDEIEGDTDLLKVTVELQHFAEDYAELERLCGLTSARTYPPQYMTANASADQAAEEIATAERNRLGVGDGPIGNLRERLESDVGLRVFYFEMPSRISGMFAFNEKLGGCAAININHPRDRRQWSLSHEYGHLLTTRYQAEVTYLVEKRRNSHKERLADGFAKCFLMPASGLNRRFSELNRASEEGITLAQVCTLADLYQVSLQAMILRLEELRRLPGGTWAKLEAQGLEVRRAQQMLNIDVNVPVQDKLPRRYQRLAVMAYEKGELSEGQLTRYLRTDRVSARMLVEEMTQDFSTEREGIYEDLELDLALPLNAR
jgi:Zn-dependent peptidase ImmA (M78 family)/DNA-binding XRE family transcriptional regulator